MSIGLILSVALSARLATLVVHSEVFPLPQGTADAVAFERLAWTFSSQGRESWSTYLTSGDRFLPFLGSFVYDLVGRQPYVLGVLMTVLGTGVVLLIYLTALSLWRDIRIARLVAWAGALFPQLVLHSALFLRETPAAFCLAAGGLFLVRFLGKHSVPDLAWFLLWILLGSLFHSGVMFAIPGLLAGLFLVRRSRSRSQVRFYAANVAVSLILVTVIYALNETGLGLQKFGGSFDSALDRFEAQEQLDTQGGAAFPEWMRLREGVRDAWKIPVRYGAFLFSPLVPFMVRSQRHLLGLVDAALYLGLFFLLVRHWRTVTSNRPALVLLVVVLGLFLVYTLGVSNFGTAIRHRAKISPLLLVLAAGLPWVKRRRFHEPA